MGYIKAEELTNHYKMYMKIRICDTLNDQFLKYPNFYLGSPSKLIFTRLVYILTTINTQPT
jgi:hypothetical protein